MKQVPSVGRIVHIYSLFWTGPRPGIIVSVCPAPVTSGDLFANINVMFDGTTDSEMLAACRASALGNTLPQMFVNEPLDAKTRDGLLEQARISDDKTFRWAEWPPMVVPRPNPHFSQANGAELGRELRVETPADKAARDRELGDGPRAMKPPEGLRTAVAGDLPPPRLQDDDGDCD